MNIFYLDHNPKICAQYHVDKHVIKMIVEYAQLLSTAHRVLDGYAVEEKNAIGHKLVRYYLDDPRDAILYKSTHINHPSALWVRQSKENYEWLYLLFIELLAEYTFRYGKKHATSALVNALSVPPLKIPNKPFTQPTPAMDIEYIIADDSISSYRRYYIKSKSELIKYTKRPTPSWLLEG